MSKEKQIEEMAVDLCRIDLCKHLEEEQCDATTCVHCSAEALYNAGYRKQSEWISVDERLPQVSGKYICCVKDNRGNAWTITADLSWEMKTWFGEFGEIKNKVTHWMPLPEPPRTPKERGAE